MNVIFDYLFGSIRLKDKSAAASGSGSEVSIVPLTSTAITPEAGAIYTKTLAADDAFTIDASGLSANTPITFKLVLTQPATPVSFTLPASILWPGDDENVRPYAYYPVYNSTNLPPAMSVGSREYTIVIHWDGRVLRGNLEYATEITTP